MAKWMVGSMTEVLEKAGSSGLPWAWGKGTTGRMSTGRERRCRNVLMVQSAESGLSQ